MQNKHEQYFVAAGRVAMNALCLRDKCGAVIVLNGNIIGEGYNAPPCDDIAKRKCVRELRESRKPKSDRTCCLHAEWRAIMVALRQNISLAGSTLYFTRIDDLGNLKRSGDPYCTVCSRLACDVGITNFALWQKTGIAIFPSDLYNDMSYAFHEIPPQIA